MRRLGASEATHLLEQLQSSVAYFCERRPVERMEQRLSDPTRGEPREGQRHQRDLASEGDSVARLNALAQIVYLVRCNLAHGSKSEAGDDREVVAQALHPLRFMLESALRMSEMGRA